MQDTLTQEYEHLSTEHIQTFNAKTTSTKAKIPHLLYAFSKAKDVFFSYSLMKKR